MTLRIKRGDALVLVTATTLNASHREPLEGPCDFTIHTEKDKVLFKAAGSTTFLTIDFAKKECEVDVLNWAHIDVGARKKKAEEAAAGPKEKKERKRKVETLPNPDAAVVSEEPKAKKQKVKS
jgi:hypothetical protein